MSTLTWITEEELERKIKKQGDQFRWKKNDNFIYNDGKKKGKSLAATKVKMSSSEKSKKDYRQLVGTMFRK